MKTFLFLLLCVSQCHAQLIGNLLLAPKKNNADLYVPHPDCPTFSTPFLLEQATTGTTIVSGELGGSTELIIDANPGYDFMQLNGITGSIKQFQSESQSNDPATWSNIGHTGTGGVISSVNNTTNIELYCLTLSTRSQGITWDASGLPGTNLKTQNLIFENLNASGYQINQSNPGIDYYGDMEFTFTMMRNIGNENEYLGSTVAVNNQTTFNSIYVRHHYADSCQWDMFQNNGNLNLDAAKITMRHGALAAVVGQDRCLQLQNVRGTFRDFILDSAGNTMNIAANSLRIANGFLYSYRDAFGTQIDMSDNNLNDTEVLPSTSTDTETIPTIHPTNVTFTLVEASRGYVPGELLLVRNDNTHYFYGTVQSYSDPTLVITSEYNVGTGSFSTWDISGLVLYDSLTIYSPNLTSAWVMQVNENACSIIAKDCVIPTVATNFFDDNRSSTFYLLDEINITNDDTPELPQYQNPPESIWIPYEQVLVPTNQWYIRGAGHRTP